MRRIIFATGLWAIACPLLVFAQRGGNDWMTTGFDAQRSNWVRLDSKISPESMRKPGFALVWKMKMGAGPVTAPALLDFYIGYRGFRTLAFFGAGSANKVVAVDSDLGRLEWEKNFGAAAPGAGACPGGMTAAVTRPTIIAYPAVPTGRGFGRGTPAKSGVGEPYEGAVTLKQAPVQRPAPPKPAPAKPAAAAEFNPFAPRVQYAIALSADGKLHSMWLSNGNETSGGVPFVPPNANASGLIVFDNTAFVSTTGGCGGAANGVWALDLTNKQVKQWKSQAKTVYGPAVGPDGTLYVAADKQLVALEPKNLEAKSTFKNDGGEFRSSPVVFEYKGKNLLAATTAHGRLKLFDAEALNSAEPLDTAGPYAEQGFEARALASWQDVAGTRWILSPSNNNVTAFKVVDKGGKPGLEQAWKSPEMVAPLPPIVVSGVVFALAGGSATKPAVLYALDGATGNELWNSGSAIASYAKSGGLSAGGTRVYVATQDGTEYAFGFPIEH